MISPSVELKRRQELKGVLSRWLFSGGREGGNLRLFFSVLSYTYISARGAGKAIRFRRAVIHPHKS
jgi:hypothetical protein